MVTWHRVLQFTFLVSCVASCACYSISSETDGDGPSTRHLATKPSLCFEKMDDSGAWLSMRSHPADASLAVVSSQAGLLELVRLPRPHVGPGKGSPMQRLGTWLDLRNRTLLSGERGFLDFAFHHTFLATGRFFVSYICDSNAYPDCAGNCACNSAVGCNPKTNPVSTCNGHTIVAEYRVKGRPAAARQVAPKEIRKILKIGRPYSNHNGGAIFFGRDNYLYYTSGDGGNAGDPWNNAQKGNTFLGKVLRLDVDHIPRGHTYGIPKDNPFVKVSGVRPELYALGFRNPWRASVDRATGAVWIGDVGQDVMEEVDRLLPGRNYGWHNYEGTRAYKATGATPGGFTPRARMLGNLTSPVLQYLHTAVGDTGAHPKSVAVIGGFVYRANRNKCLQGKYIYMDAYGPVWVGTVYGTARPASTAVALTCAPSSPLACAANSFGAVKWGWAEDSSGEVYLLSNNGVYRIADQNTCGATC